MRIILSGASGFLGRKVLETLKVDHEMVRLGRHPEDHLYWDMNLGKCPELPPADLMVHVAGKAHVSGKREVGSFHRINTLAAVELLKRLSEQKPAQVILISTVAVYGAVSGEDLDEGTPLKGESPYAVSKIEEEQLFQAWGEKHGTPVLILRLPLISGTNPPGNLLRLRKGLEKGYYFRLAGKEIKRTLVAAADVAEFLPLCMNREGVYNLCGTPHSTIWEIEEKIALQVGCRVKRMPGRNVVLSLLKRISIAQAVITKLTESLTFSDRKARLELGWNGSDPLKALEIVKKAE